MLVDHVRILRNVAGRADRENKTVLDYVAEHVSEPSGSDWRKDLGDRFADLDAKLSDLIGRLD